MNPKCGCYINIENILYFPRHPVIFSDSDWDVQSPPKCKAFGFHYHSQEVIGSLGIVKDCIERGSSFFSKVSFVEIDIGKKSPYFERISRSVRQSPTQRRVSVVLIVYWPCS